VALWSHDHHALWVSPRVLTELGITTATPEPPGGTFRRGADGTPDGILQEMATQAVVARLPAPSRDALEAAIAAYARTLLSLGVVGAHDPGDLLPDATLEGGFGATVGLADRGELPIRVACSIRTPALATAVARGLRTGQPLGGDGSDRVTMGWLKLFADGALGSRTALLLEPYEGTSDHGIAVTPAAELASLAARSAAAGIVPQVHAIGDAALRSAVAALTPIAPDTGPMARVEHVQLADLADLAAMAAARIGASIQPVHLRSDVGKARAAWGPRAESRAFLLRSLFAAGIPTAFGTDAPVEPADPWPGIAIAVTRRAPGWPGGDTVGATEAIDLAIALRAATRGPATIAAQPDRGHLDIGAHADFVAIPAAALDTPDLLWHVRPVLTALDGKVAFET
jgi:predicted amidohydrolase YtcJ